LSSDSPGIFEILKFKLSNIRPFVLTCLTTGHGGFYYCFLAIIKGSFYESSNVIGCIFISFVGRIGLISSVFVSFCYLGGFKFPKLIFL